MEYTPEMLAMLQAQVEYMSSDDRIREEVEIWRDTTPEQRLAEVAEMCANADFFLSQLPPDRLARVTARQPLPPDTIDILVALRDAYR